MPFISDTAMQKVATKLQSFETREEKRKVEVRQKLNEAKVVAESSLGAALVGFMHGRFEDADANFFIPRTSIPADFAMGLTGVGLAFFDMFGRADEDVLNFSNGVLSGATAMYFRKHALAGKQASKFWAGAPELMAPITHNHPSIGAAMSDADLAAALRKSL
ncbi:MAG: hypothetical protein ABI627_18800 [Polyangiaceae bacterium]|jgi:hypothetical protein